MSDLDALDAGRPPELLHAVSEMMPVLYAELRRAAHRERWRFRAGDTLATTALLSEAYLRLARSPGFESHGAFLRVAAIAMRRILIERVRAQLTAKRGGSLDRVPLGQAEELEVEGDERLYAVNEALQGLATKSPRLAEIVECRFFAGYSEKETADALGLSERTVQRDWATARAWLQRELQESPQTS
jgi:RNA polymerase sigma factor (TIGR02999 family)